MTKLTYSYKLKSYCQCFLGFLLLPLFGISQLTFMESEAGIQIKEGDKNVFFYQKQPNRSTENSRETIYEELK